MYAQGTTALLAVTSRGGNGKRPTASQPWAGCVGSNAFNLFTRVDGFAALIKQTVSEVGETVWEEGTPKPDAPPTTDPGDPTKPPPPDPGELGAVCASNDECASGICVAWKDEQVCSQTCDEANACPSSFACVGGYCVEAEPAAPGTGDPPASSANGADGGTSSSGSYAMTAPSTSGGSAVALCALAGLAMAARRRREAASPRRDRAS